MGITDGPVIEQALTARDLQAALQQLATVKWTFGEEVVTFQSFVGAMPIATVVIPNGAFMQIARDFALKQKQVEDIQRAARHALKTKL